MSVQKKEKYCERCEKYRPIESEFLLGLINVSGEGENEEDIILFCPDCSEPLSIRECCDDVDQFYASCVNCHREIDSDDRFCIYCRHPNQHYDHGYIPLVRCRQCQKDDKPIDLIDDGRSRQFCFDCAGDLERVNYVMSSCECGNLLEPWCKFCEQCRLPNKAYKTDEKILEIFDADG